MQDIVEQFQDQVRRAANARRPLRIRGGGTKDWYGMPLDGELLDTRAYAGIVDFEPPHFGDSATIGGAIASGLSGPRRANSGAVRDFVLGAKLMDGKGDVLNF